MDEYSVSVHTMLSINWNTSNIDVMDHFSLNQCRSEEITLKEDFGSGFLNFADIGKNQFVLMLWCFLFFCFFICFVSEEPCGIFTSNLLLHLTFVP